MTEQVAYSAAAVRIAEEVPAVGPGLPLRGLICAAADAEIQPLIEAIRAALEDEPPAPLLMAIPMSGDVEFPEWFQCGTCAATHWIRMELQHTESCQYQRRLGGLRVPLAHAKGEQQ